ncbi:MAG: DUF4349 domain-containing protein [Oscillospiraceae bacterium]|nr:DUF4349 domain-containing protein [Oscillospiraceae bacterium]
MRREDVGVRRGAKIPPPLQAEYVRRGVKESRERDKECMMKKYLSAILALSICVSLSACSDGGSSGGSSASGGGSNYSPNIAYDGAYEGEYMQMASPEVSGGGTAALDTVESDISAKIIRNASLTVRAVDVKRAYDEYLAYISTHGGYEFNMELSSSGDYTTIHATLKLPPQILNAAVEYAHECGEVTSIFTSSDDITEQYYDVRIRLENKRRNLEKYYQYLDEASIMEDVIKLQNQIDSITMEIEAFEGRLRMWDSLVKESTINITFIQKDDPNKTEEEIKFSWNSMDGQSMWLKMSNGFLRTSNAVFSLFQWLIIIVVNLLPVLIIAFIVLVLINLKKRKGKKASVALAENNETKLTDSPEPPLHKNE